MQCHRNSSVSGLPKQLRSFSELFYLLLIFDLLIAILGPYLSANVPFFSGKLAMHIISDLLFFMGAVIFAVGAFLEIGTAYFQKEKTTDAREGSHEKHMSLGVLFMIVEQV